MVDRHNSTIERNQVMSNVETVKGVYAIASRDSEALSASTPRNAQRTCTPERVGEPEGIVPKRPRRRSFRVESCVASASSCAGVPVAGRGRHAVELLRAATVQVSRLKTATRNGSASSSSSGV
jgi:hypothetical protein